LVVDYSKVKIDFDQKSKQLKLERIRLLQEKIKEKTGKDVKINLHEHMTNNRKDTLNLSAIMGTGPFKSDVSFLKKIKNKLENLDKIKSLIICLKK
jgi:hypothetical protein